MVLDVGLDLGEDPLGVLSFGYWEEDDFDGILVAVEPQYFLDVVDGEDLHIRALEIFKDHELVEKRLEHLQKLVDVDFVEVFRSKDLREEAGEEELELFFVFHGGGKHQEGLLLHCHLDVIAVGAFQIVNLGLSEDEGLGFYCSFLEGDPPGHVLDMLDDEID